MINSNVRNSIAAVAVFVVLAAFAFLSQTGASADTVSWHKDLSGTLQEAKSQNKFVLADVYTDWCGWCKKLDRDTFTDPGLTVYLQSKFVCTKLNAEDGGEGQKAAKDNGISGYPSALVFGPNGKLLGKIVGYRDAAGYQQELQKYVDGYK